MAGMKLTRRGLLGAALAAPALITVPARAAFTAPQGVRNTGWYRFGHGDFQITILSDGNLLIPTDGMAFDQPREEVTAYLKAHHLDPERNYSHTNHVLIDTGDAKVLVDVGSGANFQPTAGRLVANMEAAGIDPAEITHVVLTHAHPDHVWGMMDDFGDEPRIPEAEYAIAAAEYDWWMAEDRIDQVPEVMQGFVVGAQNALEPMAERMAMVEDGHEVVPGITLVSTPGHTMGHMAVMVSSGGQQLLVTGDAITHPYMSFEHPEWQSGRDTDPEMGVAARKRLLDMAATDGIAISSYHIPFPGIGHVARRGDAYEFLPAPWRWGEG